MQPLQNQLRLSQNHAHHRTPQQHRPLLKQTLLKGRHEDGGFIYGGRSGNKL